jgi:hypothetical protein
VAFKSFATATALLLGEGLQAIGARLLGIVLAFCLFLFVGCLRLFFFLHFFGPLFFYRLN